MSNPQSETTESILADRAYTGYLAGRIAGIVPVESQLRNQLATRYASTSRQPSEVYCFILGAQTGGSAIMSPAQLLDHVYQEVCLLAPAPKPQRRRPRPDDRWGVRS